MLCRIANGFDDGTAKSLDFDRTHTGDFEEGFFILGTFGNQFIDGAIVHDLIVWQIVFFAELCAQRTKLGGK